MSRRRYELLSLPERFARAPRLVEVGSPLVNARAHRARRLLSDVGPTRFLVENDKLSRAYDGGVRQLGLVRQGQQGDPAALQPPPTWRPLGGAMQNNRGRTITLPAIVADQGTYIVSGEGVAQSVVETDKNAGDDAEMISVKLGLEWSSAEPGHPVDIGLLGVKAVITWGIGGTIYQAKCDWVNGLSFSLSASFVRIGAIYDAFVLNGVTPPDAILSASLAYGQNPSRSTNLRYTQWVGLDGFVPIPVGASPNLAPGDSIVQEIPKHATAFTYMAGGLSNPNMLFDELAMADVAGTWAAAGLSPILAQYVYDARDNQARQSELTFPIVNGAQFLRITNNSGQTPGTFDAGAHISPVSFGAIVYNLSL